MELLLNLFRTGPEAQDIFGSAFRAQLHGRLCETAVMAHQRAVFVFG